MDYPTPDRLMMQGKVIYSAPRDKKRTVQTYISVIEYVLKNNPLSVNYYVVVFTVNRASENYRMDNKKVWFGSSDKAEAINYARTLKTKLDRESAASESLSFFRGE